ETARPAIGVVHTTFWLVGTFQVTGVGAPSATPDAWGPRNDGQFWAETDAHAATHRTTGNMRLMIYLPSTRVHVVALLGKPTEITLSPSRRIVSVTPGASTTPNVVASRATKVIRCPGAALPFRRPPATVRTNSVPPGP